MAAKDGMHDLRKKEAVREAAKRALTQGWVSWTVPLVVVAWLGLLAMDQGGFSLPESLDLTGGVQLKYQLDPTDCARKGILSSQEKRNALGRVQEVFLLRLRHFDLSELTVRPLGDDRITIEVPGAETIDRVKGDLLGGAGLLTFRLVLDGPKPLDAFPDSVREDCLKRRDDDQYYWLDEPLLDASHINYRSTRVDFGQHGRPTVVLGLKGHASTMFAELTTRFYEKQLAICFDDTIVSAPVITAKGIHQPIITGDFSVTEAQQLVKVLRAGPLPVALNRVSEVLVSPTLGKETRQCGFIALAVGISFVLALLLLAYCDHATMLVTFLVCLPLEALLLYTASRIGWVTLNMTSLSGLVVLMGISVDNLILFFEEYRNIQAAPPKADPTAKRWRRTSLSAGDLLASAFKVEMPVILWANLTTVAALAPLWFLEGPIKDLVSVMILGIGIAVGVNVYYARRLLRDIFVAREQIASLGTRKVISEKTAKRLEHLSPFSKPFFLLKFDLYRLRYAVLGLYAIALASSLLLLATRGLELGPDFKELTDVVLLADRDIGTDRVTAMADEFFGERCQVKRMKRPNAEQGATVEYSVRVPRSSAAEGELTEDDWTRGTVITNDKTAEDFLLHVRSSVDVGLQVGSVEMVGPTVIALNRTVIVVSAAVGLLLMTLFIAIAYGGSYATPVVAALVLDGVITLGAISLLGVPLSIPVAAAILTIIGYSINDSIVLCGHVHPGRKNRDEDPKAKKAGPLRHREELTAADAPALAAPMPRLTPEYLRSTLRELSSRVLLTSLTTAGAALALWIFGRSILRDFGMVIAVGAIFGTLSSVSLVVVALERSLGEKKAEPAPETPTEDADTEVPGDAQS